MKTYPVKLVPVDLPELRGKPPAKKGKLIVQIARTNCAGAIWRIHDAINAYTQHTCRTITASDTTNGRKYPHDIFLSHVHEVKHLLQKADVIHFHNWVDHESPEMQPYQEILAQKRKVLQYHTEPALLQRSFRRNVITRSDLRTLVIAQKHVRFYPNSIIVPNMVDIFADNLRPAERNNPKLKVIYTPSDTKNYPNYASTCCGKGYSQVMFVLQKLKTEGLIDVTVITDKTWEELMPIKQQHDVCIDECVTGGYHLCSLEALSQGLVTIAWLDEKTQEAIKQVVGRETPLPWENTRQDDLEAKLRHLAKNPAEVREKQAYSRKWMTENWNPTKLVNRFINAYFADSVTVRPTFTVEDKNQGVVAGARVSKAWGDNVLLPVYKVPGIIRPECRALKDAWADRQVIIWGNGPSVAEAVAMKDQEWFKQCKHIGTNAASRLGLPFDAYCIGDKRFVEVPEKREIALRVPGIKVYQSVLRPFLPPDLDASFIETIGRNGFCSDLGVGIYHGYSVVWFALQVALWTGTKNVLLAGCGHDYNSPQPRFYKEAKVSEVDNSLPYILHNYRNLIPLLATAGISIATIGKSRLSDAGVQQKRF